MGEMPVMDAVERDFTGFIKTRVWWSDGREQEVVIVASINPKIFCAICGCLPQLANLMRCGNILCNRCVGRYTFMMKQSCPCGREDEWGCGNPFRYTMSNDQLNDLLVNCPNREEGCEALVPLVDLDVHLAACPRGPAVVPAGYDTDLFECVVRMIEGVCLAINVGLERDVETDEAQIEAFIDAPPRKIDIPHANTGEPKMILAEVCSVAEREEVQPISESNSVLGFKPKPSLRAATPVAKRGGRGKSRGRGGLLCKDRAAQKVKPDLLETSVSDVPNVASSLPEKITKSSVQAHSTRLKENEVLYTDEGVLRLLESGVQGRTRRTRKFLEEALTGLDQTAKSTSSVPSGDEALTKPKSSSSGDQGGLPTVVLERMVSKSSQPAKPKLSLSRELLALRADIEVTGDPRFRDIGTKRERIDTLPQVCATGSSSSQMQPIASRRKSKNTARKSTGAKLLPSQRLSSLQKSTSNESLVEAIEHENKKKFTPTRRARSRARRSPLEPDCLESKKDERIDDELASLGSPVDTAQENDFRKRARSRSRAASKIRVMCREASPSINGSHVAQVSEPKTIAIKRRSRSVAPSRGRNSQKRTVDVTISESQSLDVAPDIIMIRRRGRSAAPKVGRNSRSHVDNLGDASVQANGTSSSSQILSDPSLDVSYVEVRRGRSRSVAAQRRTSQQNLESKDVGLSALSQHSKAAVSARLPESPVHIGDSPLSPTLENKKQDDVKENDKPDQSPQALTPKSRKCKKRIDTVNDSGSENDTALRKHQPDNGDSEVINTAQEIVNTSKDIDERQRTQSNEYRVLSLFANSATHDDVHRTNLNRDPRTAAKAHVARLIEPERIQSLNVSVESLRSLLKPFNMNTTTPVRESEKETGASVDLDQHLDERMKRFLEGNDSTLSNVGDEADFSRGSKSGEQVKIFDSGDLSKKSHDSNELHGESSTLLDHSSRSNGSAQIFQTDASLNPARKEKRKSVSSNSCDPAGDTVETKRTYKIPRVASIEHDAPCSAAFGDTDLRTLRHVEQKKVFEMDNPGVPHNVSPALSKLQAHSSNDYNAKDSSFSSSSSLTSRHKVNAVTSDAARHSNLALGNESNRAECRTDSYKHVLESCRAISRGRDHRRDESRSPEPIRRHRSPSSGRYERSHSGHRSRSRPPPREGRAHMRQYASDNNDFREPSCDGLQKPLQSSKDSRLYATRDHYESSQQRYSAMYNDRSEAYRSSEWESSGHTEGASAAHHHIQNTRYARSQPSLGYSSHADSTLLAESRRSSENSSAGVRDVCREIPMEPLMVIRLTEPSVPYVRPIRSVIELRVPRFLSHEFCDPPIIERESIREIGANHDSSSEHVHHSSPQQHLYQPSSRISSSRDPRCNRRSVPAERAILPRAANLAPSTNEMRAAVENALRYKSAADPIFIQWGQELAACQSDTDQRALIRRYYQMLVAPMLMMPNHATAAPGSLTPGGSPYPGAMSPFPSLSPGPSNWNAGAYSAFGQLASVAGSVSPYSHISSPVTHHGALPHHTSSPLLCATQKPQLPQRVPQHPMPPQTLPTLSGSQSVASHFYVARGYPGAQRAPLFDEEDDGSRFSDDDAIDENRARYSRSRSRESSYSSK